MLCGLYGRRMNWVCSNAHTTILYFIEYFVIDLHMHSDYHIAYYIVNKYYSILLKHILNILEIVRSKQVLCSSHIHACILKS